MAQSQTKFLSSALLAFWVCSTLLVLQGCSHLPQADHPAPTPQKIRAQLSIGYSLLYEEADGIHKLKWIVFFKEKSDEMAQTTNELVDYYARLAEDLRKVSHDYPAVHIDVTTMSDIEAQTRKAIGEDMAKDIAPVIGKGGMAFEREILLTLQSGLNEQRHLVATMLTLEPDAGLKQFLEKTRTQLDERYVKISRLLERRYFAPG